MEIIINEQKINYIIKGEGQPIVILHGWGSSFKVFQSMIDFLSLKNKVIALDLPGFGDSPEPEKSWNLDDYVKLVKEFMDTLKINKPILIGHSFGGRISIKLGSDPKVKLEKIILIDSAGIKKEKQITLKVKVLKLLRKIVGKFSPTLIEKMKNKLGSEDYRNATPIMRETLVNVIGEDLTDLLPKINHSTLLIWGVNDFDTPLSDALLMESLIKDAGLVKVENAGHYSFLDNPRLVHKVIDVFVGGDK